MTRSVSLRGTTLPGTARQGKCAPHCVCCSAGEQSPRQNQGIASGKPSSQRHTENCWHYGTLFSMYHSLAGTMCLRHALNPLATAGCFHIAGKNKSDGKANWNFNACFTCSTLFFAACFAGVRCSGLICHQTVACATNINQTRRVLRVLFNNLPQLMNMPFGEFLRLAYVCLIALHLSDQGLIINYIG